MKHKIQRAKKDTRWWRLKWDTLVYAPDYAGSAIGDMDGEWKHVAFRVFRLVVDTRNPINIENQ